MTDWGMLVARLFLGIPFVIWGTMKIRGGDASLVPVLKALHLPDAPLLAFMVGVCELVGGLGIVAGYPARTFGVLLGLWCLATGFETRGKDKSTLLSHITMAGGFFAVAAAGSGSLALFGGHPTGIFAHLP